MQFISEKNRRQLKAVRLIFSRNNRRFWRRYHRLFTLLLVTAICDCYSTIYFMYILGIDREVHPHIRMLSYILGPVAGPVIGKSLQCGIGILGTIYCYKWARVIMWTAIIMYTYAALHNIFLTQATLKLYLH